MNLKTITFGFVLMLAGTAALYWYAPSRPANPGKIPAPVTGYNYTFEGIQGFSVNDASGQNLPPFGGGGGQSCCIMLPTKWTPDLKATVRWTIGHFTKPWGERKNLSVLEQEACCWTQRTVERTVPIEPYAIPGVVQVFFLPDDKIRVYSFDAGPQNPDHPSKMGYPEDPRPKTGN